MEKKKKRQCPICLEKRDDIVRSNGLILHELQCSDFNAELFQMYLDYLFVFNSGELDLAAVGVNITGIKMLFESKWSEYLNLDDIP